MRIPAETAGNSQWVLKYVKMVIRRNGGEITKEYKYKVNERAGYITKLTGEPRNRKKYSLSRLKTGKSRLHTPTANAQRVRDVERS